MRLTKKMETIVFGTDQEWVNDDAENAHPSTIDDPNVNLKKVRISQNEMMTMSPTSKKRVSYSDSDIVESFNGVRGIFTTNIFNMQLNIFLCFHNKGQKKIITRV